MKTIKIGDTVKMAMGHDVLFTVIKSNTDGTFVIEAKLDKQQFLSYDNVSREMLKLVE